jgi:hypothetical protein
VADIDVSALSPEEQSKSLVRAEYDKLDAQSDFFGWQLRLHDAGDYYVIFVRVENAERVFVEMLECDDYPQQAPRATFIDPELFESADETTKPDGAYYPTGQYMVLDRGPFPVMCIKGHRDYYSSGWHDGWTNPPAHDHSLCQHVVNVRNALLDIWS